MSSTDLNYCEIDKTPLISRMVSVKFISIMIYLYIYVIHYRMVNWYCNKKTDKTVRRSNEEEEIEENVKVLSTNEIAAENLEAEVVNLEAEVVNLENDVNTWYKFEDGKGRYKGEWKNGLPNGKGIKHAYKDDSYIYGNFVDGFSEGYGKQTFGQTWEKTQPYYEGEFKRNNYHGKGEYHYGDGDYYKGDWKDGKYHGQGAAYSKRLNRTWVGEYKNDEKGEGNWVKGEI
jgi:hypothetical protein